MDEFDSAIVRNLQEDARQSNRDIARKLGIAPSTCLERTRLLRARGVIRGYHAEVDLPALNRGVQAMVAVQVRPLSRSVVQSFERSVARLPEVLSVFTMAGSDDFLVHVTAQDIDHLHAFLLDRFTSRREIVGFRTSIIYQHLRKPVLEPLADVP
ncbi:Lrp/AsnC family transcriptional regulator [Amycolatopsis acidiphila]|uniref:Lrp/AsnC family transcriptional regulator n=1 Tax=Amycolatopsis acidiphila TaxID=715473 RepID=A0A558AHF8_9PSEU|nr:Lrp/AsnC family transcriptional regulator [Amycolatopsis acidiphila]TVT23690.1 Lrp/AsnC family transcriptional regulator [Amycolatopsis acidiphila]UIJ58682.1 Lrp/AsnC family transcriptional regulator [Amycolatopsis acidiphila]GHG76051.1 AsnC family transcriptional regulator [Amycolatopsis acidiphila]